MKNKLILFFLTIIIVLSVIVINQEKKDVSAQPPANFVNELFVNGLTNPTNIAFTPDGRTLVTEEGCKVQVVMPGKTVIESTPFLQVPNCQDYLMSIVLDPNFTQNNYFYLYYDGQNPYRGRVVRYTANGATASPQSERLIWQSVTDALDNNHHKGGALSFGEGGKLFITTGDHGNNTLNPDKPSQNLTSDLGKILRVNSDGTVPTDNPFFDGSGPNRDEIWAYGVRNPFRLQYDAQTNRLLLADVGQFATEEIDVITKGGNYGWPVCEGTCNPTNPSMIDPIFTYSANPQDRGSITGGFVYRGTQFPTTYNGVYFYGDFVRNTIRYLTFNGTNQVSADQPFEPFDSAEPPEALIVAIAQGPDGMLYYVDYIGSVRRIKYIAPTSTPTPTPSKTPTPSPTKTPTPTLTKTPTPTPTPLVLNYSLKFNGTSHFTKTNDITLSTPFTMETWIKHVGDLTTKQVIMSGATKDTGELAYSLYVDGSGTVCNGKNKLVFYQLKKSLTHCTSQVIEKTPWYHVAVVRDETAEIRIYVNGKKVAGVVNTPNIPAGIYRGIIGRNAATNTEYFSGFIDEVRISKIARFSSNFSPSLISYTNDSNTIALWHFDEGTGQVIEDSSSNGYDGTLGKTIQVETNDPEWKVRTKLKKNIEGNYVE